MKFIIMLFLSDFPNHNIISIDITKLMLISTYLPVGKYEFKQYHFCILVIQTGKLTIIKQNNNYYLCVTSRVSYLTCFVYRVSHISNVLYKY